MKNYKYVARDSSGERREGFSRALTANDVLAFLREQGLIPVAIGEIKEEVDQGRFAHHRKRIRSADLATFCWQLTTMLEGGIPITVSLDTIAEDAENERLHNVLAEVSDKVKKGQPLSQCLAEFPNVFNQLSRAIILAGETGGNLADAAKKLALYFDNRDKLAKKVKAAMAYPIFVFSFVLVIITVIMLFIIPRFKTIFDMLGGQLPAFTRGFMWVYDSIVHNLIFLAGGIFLFVAAIILIRRTKKGHYLFSRIVLRLPLFGKLLAQAFVATMCRTMATLLEAGVSVLDVLDILYEMSANDVIKTAVAQTREHIEGGSNISLSMSAAGFFPNMLVKMVQVGEESGSLPAVLERTAEHYERRIDATISTIMTLIEPTLIVTVGGIVLTVLLALYLPIFTMSGAVK